MAIGDTVQLRRNAASRNDPEWVRWAIRQIEADFARSSDTHLIKLPLPLLADNGIDLYLKDESTHPSGSLKHRLARSLFLYGLANGWIHEGCPIVEASSGSTAISEAYFAQLLKLPFVAIAPSTTAKAKLRAIEFLGGQIHLTDPGRIYADAQCMAEEAGGHYMDQFTYAERATDWRSNNNIAESLFAQMRREPHPVPAWVVVSAGTGGTSSTIGRYIRYKSEEIGSTRLCVVDPDNSVFFDYFVTGRADLTLSSGSRIEGIGRPRVEASFLPSVVDAMIKVPDAATIATIHWLETIMNRRVGGSTGTNVYGALAIATEMLQSGEQGSIVTIICDGGDRYATTYYDAAWIRNQGLDTEPYREILAAYCRGS